jgi:hypothetical protein
MDRETRKLIHDKGNKMKVVNRPPEPREGSDGDMRLQTTGIGAVLYVKGQGRWWKFEPNTATDDGWHGSRTKVKINASEFLPTPNTAFGLYGPIIAFGRYYINNALNNNSLVANIYIPSGYIPTAIRIYGFQHNGSSSDYPGITVREQKLSDNGGGSVILNGGDWDEEQPLSGASPSGDDNYLHVTVGAFYGYTYTDGGGTNIYHMLRGGYVKLAPVISSQKIVERALDEDVLARGG